MGLNGMQVAPFGPKLGQNVTPSLRIILEGLLDPKTLFKKSEKQQHIKIIMFAG